jgi:4-amino-4-deoxy-L-arabinose transferase-like glycosyltransferase
MRSAARRTLAITFIAGLAIRLAVLSQTGTLGPKIVDEQQYTQLAENIVAGHGFAWAAGQPTSIRPPLFPGLLAATWTALGTTNFQAIRVIQILLSLATAWLVFVVGRAAWNEPAAAIGAATYWLYPSLILYDSLILSETLFIFLLMAFVAATVQLVRVPRALTAIACGVALGLAALTRSVLWPLPLLLCPGLLFVLDVPWLRRIALAAAVFAAYAAVVGPWAVRNTRLQRVVTIVDTMSGMNLRMGNYEYTPDDRMWDAVSLTGEKNWVHGISNDFGTREITEGDKDKWAQRKAIEYMRAHPRETFRRSLIKFADFWGLEREFMAGVQQGLFSPPLWFAVLASAAILFGYVLVAVVGAAGLWIARPRDARVHAIMLLPIVVLVGAHAIAFGHSRYHLPLMPILCLYAAALVVERMPSLAVSRRPALIGAAASITVLLAVWVRQIVLTDLDRIMSLLHRVS